MLAVTERQATSADRDWLKLLGLVAALGLLLLIIYYFKLESQAFFHLAALAFGGFVVHYLLPLPLRLPFFLLLSLSGAVLVFGWQALWLIALGLCLIGLCHIPAPFSVRIAALLASGGLLAVFRAGWVGVPWSGAIWPILASMFMFRLVLYMYDLTHKPAPATIWQRLSYFFLLPNVYFPLFPVIDYRTYLRTYYSEERHRIYQVGVLWILRGLIQLILYRIVYYYVSMPPAEVEDVGDLGRWVVSGILLYLRISGQFHIIVGMLRLFGFALPETHHLYFLSTSFTDFWRRINIYWKDFMMTIFFYPSYFKLRKGGETAALIASTALVFFATWVLHAYQWFWIRGSYLLAWNDVLFWSILAVLVIANTLYETRYGRERLVAGREWTLRRAAGLVGRTVGTFAVISILWSLWSSESVEEWISVWRAALGQPSVRDARLIPAGVLAVAAFAALALWFAGKERGRMRKEQPAFSGSLAAVLATSLAVCFIGSPELYARYIPSFVPGTYVEIARSTREVRLSGHDADMLERGYYEDLLNVQRFNSQLWEVYASWPVDWSRLEDTGALRRTNDFLQQELVPSTEIHFRNATLRTNRWGMRDKDYERVPPPGTFRFALVGSSHVMGYGVDDDETFDAVLERQLNSIGRRFEVLNFAVDGYNPLQELFQLETRDLDFHPHAVLYVAHYGAPYRATLHLLDMILEGVRVPYPELLEIAEKAGMRQEIGRFEGERRLRPFQNEILAWAYRRMVTSIKARGATPVWVYLPQIGDRVTASQLARFEAVAETAGFVTLSLADCFEGYEDEAIRFGAWDNHPNPLGHRLIGEKLFERLQSGVVPTDGVVRTTLEPGE
jgi:D-alanyl-lipoteichoic acid acyltransferase DltB (MBOAT superfamily)